MPTSFLLANWTILRTEAWRRLGPLVLVAALLPLCGGPKGAIAEEAASTSLTASVSSGLLSLEARNAPLDAVLHEIAAQAGFDAIIQGELRCPVTRSFSGVPLEDALRRLLEKVPSVLIQAPAAQANSGPLERVIAWSGPRDGKTCQTRIVRKAAPAKTATSQQELRAENKARLRAVQQLAKNPTAVSVAELSGLLAHDPYPPIRRAAAAALGRIKGEEAKQALLRALKEDQDASVRLRAVYSLGQWREKAVQPLARVLSDDPEPKVRRIAAKMLGRLNNRTALRALQRAERDSSRAVRRAAARSIARLEKN